MIPGEKANYRIISKATHRMDPYKGTPLNPLYKGLFLSGFKASLCDTYCVHSERSDLTLIISKSIHKGDRSEDFGTLALLQILGTSPGLTLSQKQRYQRPITCIQASPSTPATARVGVELLKDKSFDQVLQPLPQCGLR